MTTSRPASGSQPILPQLTSLRFFAAIAIVFHHYGDEALPRHWAVDRLLHGFSSGVSFFFVLSGFVMVYAYHAYGDGMSRRSFFLARFARIYPVYLLGLALMVPVAIQWYGGRGAQALVSGLVAPAAFSLVLLQAWIPQIANHFNGPGWSLSAEVFFYLCFPAMLRARWRHFLTSNILGIGVLLWILGTVPPALALYWNPHIARSPLGTTGYDIANFVSFWPLFRIPEFVLGVLTGLFFVGPGRRTVSGWWSALAGLVFVAVLIATPIDMQLILHNSLFAPLFALIIYWAAGSRSAASRFLAHRHLVLLGEASYSMYILHWPLKSLLKGATRGFGLTGAQFYWTYLLVTILVSICVFVWIENPARKLLRRWLGASQG